MSLREFWAKNDKGSQNPLLPEDIRNLIIDTGSVVVIHAVREGDSKHGKTWFADIEIDVSGLVIPQPPMWTTAQGYCGDGGAINEPRRALMEALRGQIAEHGPIPATMVQFQAKNGNYGWDFGPPPADYFDMLDAGGAILPITPGGVEAPY
jgi:hypothetical protein